MTERGARLCFPLPLDFLDGTRKGREDGGRWHRPSESPAGATIFDK